MNSQWLHKSNPPVTSRLIDLQTISNTKKLPAKSFDPNQIFQDHVFIVWILKRQKAVIKEKFIDLVNVGFKRYKNPVYNGVLIKFCFVKVCNNLKDIFILKSCIRNLFCILFWNFVNTAKRLRNITWFWFNLLIQISRNQTHSNTILDS